MTNVSRIAPGWGAVLLGLGLAGACDLDAEPAPYVHNLTRFAITVRVRPLLGTPNCDLLPEHVGRFSQQDYAPAVRYELASGGLLPLDDPEADVPAACGAAYVRIGDFERVVYWDRSDLVGVARIPKQGDASEAQALRVGGAPQQLFVSVGDVLGTAELRREEPPLDCDISVGAPLSWSGLSYGALAVDAVQRGVDDCLSIDGSQGPVFVCVPEVMLPFGAGDLAFVDDDPYPASQASAATAAVRLTGPRGELTLYRGLRSWPTLGLGQGPLEPEACTPVRDACGSLVLPARAPIGGEPHSAGELVETPWGTQAQRVFLGRIEQVVLTAPGCEAPGPDGIRIDVAVFAPPDAADGGDDAAIDDDAGMDDDAGAQGR